MNPMFFIIQGVSMTRKKRDNWRELTRDCERSGVTAFEWCKANSIPYSTCRMWLKRLHGEKAPAENEQQGLSLWGKVETGREPVHTVEAFPVYMSAGIKLSYGMWGIEVGAGFDPALLKQIMRVVEA